MLFWQLKQFLNSKFNIKLEKMCIFKNFLEIIQLENLKETPQKPVATLCHVTKLPLIIFYPKIKILVEAIGGFQ